MNTTDIKKVLKVLKMIEVDMKADAAYYDGKPFTGKNVAAYLGKQGAAIAGLANIMHKFIDQENQSDCTCYAFPHRICPEHSKFLPFLTGKKS
jgi:hypothetical protein